MPDTNPGTDGLWNRLRRLTEPKNNKEMAALMGASMAPGVGTSLDAIDLAAGIQDRDPMRMGIALAATALPFVSAAHLKALKKGVGRFVGGAPNEARAAGRAASEARPELELSGGAPRGIAGLLPPGKQIQVYHGSGYDFDNFDMSKIGTGEGAQAFGHGLYFAEKEGVARSYREAQSRPMVTYGGVDLDGAGLPKSRVLRAGLTDVSRYRLPYRGGAVKEILEDLEYSIEDTEAKIRHALSRIEESRQWLNKTENLWGGVPTDQKVRNSFLGYRDGVQTDTRLIDSYKKDIRADQDALAWLKKDFDPSKLGHARGGKMYEVALHADPESFIDWDLPPEQQPAWLRDLFPGRMRADPELGRTAERQAELNLREMRRAIKGLEPEGASSHLTRPRNFPPRAHDLPGPNNPLRIRGIGSLYPGASARQIAEEMRSRGIPGIKYLDNVSRRRGEGTRNYVVFDDRIPEIKRKYRKGGMIRA